MSWGVARGPSLWTRSVLNAKGTYPESGWVITSWAQTLQSLGTVTGARHQEIQCRLHNPDIESRVMYMCCVVVVYMILVIMRKIAWFLFIIELHDSFNQISLSLLFVFMPCVVCFLLRWSPFRWEHMWLQCQRHLWRMRNHRFRWELLQWSY